eukprot:11160063-Lingulodinium_polyedra.AAC.1
MVDNRHKHGCKAETSAPGKETEASQRRSNINASAVETWLRSLVCSNGRTFEDAGWEPPRTEGGDAPRARKSI